MRHLLRTGQEFSCSRFKDLTHCVDRNPDGSPILNMQRLKFNHTSKVTVSWTEKKDDWTRKRSETLDTSVADPAIGSTRFRVLHTCIMGGSYEHLGHSSDYPAGHHVIAEDDNGRKIRFYQTGCFVGVTPPEDIQWLGGPEDTSEPLFPRCPDCGSEVRLIAKKGRTRELWRGAHLPIPSDFKIPTCTVCGEMMMVPEVSEPLDRILKDNHETE